MRGRGWQNLCQKVLGSFHRARLFKRVRITADTVTDVMLYSCRQGQWSNAAVESCSKKSCPLVLTWIYSENFFRFLGA